MVNICQQSGVLEADQPARNDHIVCRGCGETKHKDLYDRNAARPSGRESRCKRCVSKRKKKFYRSKKKDIKFVICSPVQPNKRHLASKIAKIFTNIVEKKHEKKRISNMRDLQ